eukprot:UN23381
MCFGFSSWIMYDDKVEPGIREILLFLNCLAQGVDAGILIQANLYAGNMAGKQKFSCPLSLFSSPWQLILALGGVGGLSFFLFLALF